jgi:hypothetical protein
VSEWKARIDGHPRIHITGADVEGLKAKAGSTHEFYYRKLLEAADGLCDEHVPRVMGTGDDHRAFGNMLDVLALALLLSGDEKYLAAVRRFLKPILAADDWQGGIGLVTGHLMGGVAVCYDWLRDFLKPPELDHVRERMIRHASMTYRLAHGQRVWWHDMFLQNWCQVPTATLGYAAAALSGEVPEADDWIAHCDFVFATAREALARDGGCEEGQSYMTYSWEWFLRYFDIARGVFGRDYFDCDWLRNAPYNILYCTLPKPVYHNNSMIFGDGRRHCEWNGPVYLLQKAAAEYRDEIIQGFASWLASRGIGIAPTGTWLNMLWYDPAVPEGDFRRLPTDRLFGELSTMYARSGWDEDAMLVGFKCTSNNTDYVREEFPGRPIAGGHNHPDAASFQVYAFGEWLAVDPGYTMKILTENHNTVLVNGAGQLGGGKMWFDARETMNLEGVAITHFESTDEYTYARADASNIYRPEARLKKFIRHLIYLKPHDLLIIDELDARRKSKFEWLVNAEQSIRRDGDAFHFERGAAKCRVVCLSPADFTTRVKRRKVAIPKGNEHEAVPEMDGLRLSPPEKTRATLLAVLLSFYKGDEPESEPAGFSIESGAVSVALRRGAETLTVRLEPDQGRVEIV